jgi:hypothetical protein
MVPFLAKKIKGVISFTAKSSYVFLTSYTDIHMFGVVIRFWLKLIHSYLFA